MQRSLATRAMSIKTMRQATKMSARENDFLCNDKDSHYLEHSEESD